MKRRKQYGFTLLGLQPGQWVLDAGCGTGLDAATMATMVAPNGYVTGIDFSAKMINEAKRRAANTNALLY